MNASLVLTDNGPRTSAFRFDFSEECHAPPVAALIGAWYGVLPRGTSTFVEESDRITTHVVRTKGETLDGVPRLLDSWGIRISNLNMRRTSPIQTFETTSALGSHTHLHRDEHDHVIVVLRGSKQFLLHERSTVLSGCDQNALEGIENDDISASASHIDPFEIPAVVWD